MGLLISMLSISSAGTNTRYHGAGVTLNRVFDLSVEKTAPTLYCPPKKSKELVGR